MSGPPKRAYEDSVHSSTSKYLHEDIGGSFPNIVAKVMSPSANEYHTTYEMGSDPRMAKIPRMESRDADKRSSLHSMYCMPPSSIGSHSDNLSSSGNRIENRDAKDTKVEGRDIRIEFKESLNEVRKETPISRSEKDVMFESRVEDGRELREVKYDKEIHDSKADIKVAEKDSYASPLTWKEHKEYHRTKRYHDNPGGNVDPWHIPHVNVHTSVEGGREGWPADMKAYVETNENVGENKVNLRNEDTFKDKDRKRKDVKFRDWGENKERNDRRGILLVCNSSSECKELREESEVDRWERERNFPKDKERPKEREKEYSKREAWNAPGNDVSKEKESVDGYSRMSEQENSASEQRKHKYFNGLRSADREVRERRKERNGDVEGDRPEKQSKQHAKELDDGHIDVEGNGERERDIFNYGVQQRKRMLRPRGSPQLPSREARYRSQMQENDGCHGKSEVALAVYKVGECLQELIRLWKEHESSKVFRMGENALNGPTLEIRIPAEHVTATNRQVRGGQLWGTDVYTDDSDLVAVLMHTGYCRPTASPPPSAIQELRATIRVLPPQDCYVSALRNNVRSRAWGAAIGCSYCVERCCIVKKGGGSIDLEPCLTHTSTVEPTLAPAAVERTMTTRAAASNALRQQKFVREVTIQYNLCSEPWIKYSISMVADKGLKKPLYTSARLKKGEVLYLETHSQRYELCFAGERVVRNSAASQNHETDGSGFQINVSHSTVSEKNSMDSENSLMDVFRWSRCKKPLPQKVMLSVGIPLPLEYVEVLEDNLDWEEVRWSQTGVWIAGKEYPLARVHFLSPN